MAEAEQSASNLEAVLADLREELKAAKRQRIRDITRHPGKPPMMSWIHFFLCNPYPFPMTQGPLDPRPVWNANLWQYEQKVWAGSEK